MSGRTLPERIREWAEREFQPQHVERVTADLIDVATGNRAGNAFEREAVRRIMEGRAMRSRPYAATVRGTDGTAAGLCLSPANEGTAEAVRGFVRRMAPTVVLPDEWPAARGRCHLVGTMPEGDRRRTLACLAFAGVREAGPLA